MSRVRGNWTDAIARDIPAPAHELADDAEEERGQVMGKFWAHDAAAMEEMDRQTLKEALAGDTEIGRLEKLRDSDFEKYMRTGAADRLMELKGRK